MKLLIIHSAYSSYGGEDRVFEQEAAALASVIGSDNLFTYTASSKGMRAMDMLVSVFFSRKHYRAVRLLIETNKIDLVHIHNFFPVLSGAVFAAARDAGAKIVHTLHNYRWWCVGGEFYRDQAGICTLCTRPNDWYSAIRYGCYRKSVLQSVAAKLAFWYYKRSGILEYTDMFFVLTAFQQMIVLAQGIAPEKVVYKPNWISRIPILQEPQREGFIYVGRLESSKGIDLLLKIWEQLPASFQLKVIGTGTLEKTLKNKYAAYPNIVFKGLVPPEKIAEEMAQSKYCIQPSRWYETFGLTILESMSQGVPVIGFAIGTRNELIENGYNGWLASEDTLKETLLMSAEYPDYAVLCRNAHTFAQGFEQTLLLQKQLKMYESLLAPATA